MTYGVRSTNLKKKGGRFQWPYCRLERVDAVFRQMMPTFQLLYGPEEQEMFLREYSIQSRGQAYEQARLQMEARAQEGYELRKRRKALRSTSSSRAAPRMEPVASSARRLYEAAGVAGCHIEDQTFRASLSLRS